MNKLTLVTGSYSGIGSVLCERLLRAGSDLLLLNRDEARTTTQMNKLAQHHPSRIVTSQRADLSDQAAIREAAAEVAARHARIDAIYYVAGALGEDLKMSVDGLEMHFAVNCVGPVLLVNLLRPQLAAAEGASVVVAGSAARNMVRQLDIAAFSKPPRNHVRPMTLYAQSKQAVTTAFEAMRDDFATDAIGLSVVDLPPTKTDMAKSRALPLIFRLARPFFASPEKSAARLIAAAARSPPARNLPGEPARGQLMKLLEFPEIKPEIAQ